MNKAIQNYIKHPFIQECREYLGKLKYYKTLKIKGLPDEDGKRIVEQVERLKDRDRFTKPFTFGDSQKIMEEGARKHKAFGHLFIHLIYNIKREDPEIILHTDTLAKKFGYAGRREVNEAINYLIEKRVLSRERVNVYVIHPNYFFNGDRNQLLDEKENSKQRAKKAQAENTQILLNAYPPSKKVREKLQKQKASKKALLKKYEAEQKADKTKKGKTEL